MDDIRQWHIGLAILVAAAIHALSTGLYLTLQRPTPVTLPPPPLIVRLPPPAPPAIRQELPAVAMPRPPAPVPVPLRRRSRRCRPSPFRRPRNLHQPSSRRPRRSRST
jgi:hypothetical protein